MYTTTVRELPAAWKVIRTNGEATLTFTYSKKRVATADAALAKANNR